MKRGILMVLSAPAGAGKDTVCELLLNEVPDLRYSVSATTRPMRSYEVEGKSYFFMTRTGFENKLEQNGFLEHVEYAGNYYGTPKTFVEEQLSQGISVILKIEVMGAAQVKASGVDGVFVFLVPPQFSDLEARLRKRGSESEKEIQERLEIAREELTNVSMYDYVVVNETVEEAVAQMKSILVAEKHKRDKMMNLEIFEHRANKKE